VNALTKHKYFYEVEFNKPGGMIMPILVEITYEDDTVDNFKYPAQIWRKVMIVPRKYMLLKSNQEIQIDPN
jgi:hypothetical protein